MYVYVCICIYICIIYTLCIYMCVYIIYMCVFVCVLCLFYMYVYIYAHNYTYVYKLYVYVLYYVCVCVCVCVCVYIYVCICVCVCVNLRPPSPPFLYLCVRAAAGKVVPLQAPSCTARLGGHVQHVKEAYCNSKRGLVCFRRGSCIHSEIRRATPLPICF